MTSDSMLVNKTEINIYLEHKEHKISFLKVLLMCLVIFECDGLITKLAGFDTVLGAWLFAFTMILFLFLSLLRLVKDKSFCEIKSFYYPLLAFFVFFIVSFISGNFIYIKPLKDWLPSLYVFTPIFIFYFLYFFKYTGKEVIWSFIWVSILISTLLIIDRISNLAFLDEYQRRSAFFLQDIRRIVLLKNEVIFGFVAVVSLLITGSRSKTENKTLTVIAVLLFLVQAFVMESRMGFLAMGVSTLTLMYIKGLTRKVLRLYVMGFLAVLFVFPVVFAEHISSLSNMSLHDSESNISIRFETFEYFYNAFLDTYGVGIGMMSSNGEVYNVLHAMENYNINDAGAYSSLFQFGFLGLFLWLFYTFMCLKSYLEYYKKTGKQDAYSAASFAFIIGFTFSLLPFSFFTSYSSISMGGILLYVMWYYRNELVIKLKTKN